MMTVLPFKNFPNDYLVIDTETTGVQTGTDLIAQVGHCLVIDRKEVDRGHYMLDWTRHPQIEQPWLQERLRETKSHVEFKNGQPTGKTYHISYERMRDEGAEPEPVLRQYAEFFREIRANGQFFVAHNGYHFDAKFLEEHFRTFIRDDFEFADDELVDTGMIEKGSTASMLPWTGDSLRSWSLRLYNQRLRGIKWNLDQHCIPKYNIDKKYGLKMSEAHDAGYDSYITHLLFEEWRSMCDTQYAARAKDDKTRPYDPYWGEATCQK